LLNHEGHIIFARMITRSFFRLHTALVCILLAGFVSAGIAQTTQTPSKTTGTNGPAAPDPAFARVVDDPKLPRVLLIGDSISIGYTVPVQNLLRGKANVHRISENGGPTTNGLAKLDKWLGHTQWDVIHFNFGIHDLKVMPSGLRQVPPKEYEENLRNIILRLKATNARLIWATTTPIPGVIARKGPRTENVPIYNEIAKKIMDENHIAIDDLYSFALPQLEKIQLPHNVHYTDAGYQALGEVVAASIESALPAKK
jgi:lysophospholipase L1-like esterase